METWYVLEDGSCGDPQEIVLGKDGKLRHKDGRAVAYAPHGPRSRGVDPEKERMKAARAGKKSANEVRAETGLPSIETPAATAEPVDPAPSEAKEMVAEKPRVPYKNREMRSGKTRRTKTR